MTERDNFDSVLARMEAAHERCVERARAAQILEPLAEAADAALAYNEWLTTVAVAVYGPHKTYRHVVTARELREAMHDAERQAVGEIIRAVRRKFRKAALEIAAHPACRDRPEALRELAGQIAASLADHGVVERRVDEEHKRAANRQRQRRWRERRKMQEFERETGGGFSDPPGSLPEIY